MKNQKEDKNTVILSLALITHIYNTGKISETVAVKVKYVKGFGRVHILI